MKQYGGWKTPAPLDHAIVDGNGGVVNRYAYDSFGVIDWDWSYETVPNRYTFQGREYDAERGDYHFRNRVYFPEWGLFSPKTGKGRIHAAANGFLHEKPTLWHNAPSGGVLDVQMR